MMTLDEIKLGVRNLSVEQHKQLFAFIVDLLAERKESEPQLKQRSILEFEGVGAEIWQGVFDFIEGAITSSGGDYADPPAGSPE